MQGTRFREIPGARYSVAALGDSPVDNQPLKSDLQFEFGQKVRTLENDGLFVITTIGIDLGRFKLFVGVDPEDDSSIAGFRSELEAVSDTNAIRTFHFTYNSASPTDCRVERVVAVREPREDLDILQKLGFVTAQSTAAKYASLFDAFVHHMSQHDSSAARNSLSAALQDIPRDSSITLLDIAPSQLRYDIGYLLGTLSSVAR